MHAPKKQGSLAVAKSITFYLNYEYHVHLLYDTSTAQILL